MGACVCRSHELSGLLLFLAAGLTRDPIPSPGCPVVFMLVDRWREGVGVDSEGGVRGSGALLLLFFVD